MKSLNKSLTLQLLFVVSVWLWFLPSALAELTATVDATEITTEQSLNYTLSTTTGTGDPDFSALQLDFDIIGQSTFSQTQSHNGKIIQNLSWRLQLLPKRAGQYTIPALTVDGQTSQPIEITVTKPKAITGADFGDFHVDVSVDNPRPYVQAQVVYTIRVYHAINFLDGSLSAPDVPGVRVESLGEDRVYQENRNGRVYRVLERRFALFPQNSGGVQLPGVVLNANVPSSSGNRGFFAPRQPIRRRGADIELEVLPRPAENQSQWWLPASAVTLQARWEGNATAAYVGESITRTLIMQANGVDSTTLPELSVPRQDEFRVYADQPELSVQSTAQGLTSQRVEKWAVIPQVSGDLTLPRLEIPWFNTTTEKFELAVLPATTLQVQPARNAVTGEVEAASTTAVPSSAQVSTLDTPPDTDSALQSTTVQSTDATHRTSLWRALAILAGVGWLCTLVAWWLTRRRDRVADVETGSAPVRPVASFQDLERAGSAQDRHGFANTLIQWAGNFWVGDAPGSLVAIAQRIDRQTSIGSLTTEHRSAATTLVGDLRKLDASLYAGATDANVESLDLSKIVKNLRQYADAAHEHKVSATPSALPPL